MVTWMPYYLFCQSTNGHLNAILFNSSAYLCTKYREKSPPPFFCLSIVNWKLEKYGSQDIIIIGIDSLNIMQYRKAHITLFVSSGILFFLRMGALPALLFSNVHTNPIFKGWLLLWGRWCMVIPQELTVKFFLVFDPVAQLFVLPAFYVHSSSIIMLEITILLNFLYQTFV